MKYFKESKTGEVYAYETEAERKEWGSPELVKMTKAEIEAHLNPPNPSLTREQIEALRLRAYADPLTGSDRYFAEAQRMQVMGEAGWEDVRAEGVKLFVAIQDKFPWPAQQTSRPDTPAPDMGRFLTGGT